MEDSELRSALLAFVEQQNELSNQLADELSAAKDQSGDKVRIDEALHCQIKFLNKTIAEGNKLIAALRGRNSSSDAGHDSETVARPVEVAWSQALFRESERAGAEEPPSLGSFEQSFVELYNNDPEKWQQRFRPKVFGAENVNELWEKGGEPRFVTKEGGIYSLVEDQGSYYVVPEPGFRLSERYFKTEGVGYLFETGNMDIEDSPVIRLVKPAKVSDCGGRFTVVSKGSIRRRN